MTASTGTGAQGPDGICIAFNQAWNTTSPTWTRLDDPKLPAFGHSSSSPHNCNCVSNWTVDRGRTYELDKTEAGTATVTLQDPNGIFDPTNLNSPYAGWIGPMNRVSISILNPASQAYMLIFTGFVESWTWTITTEEKLEVVTMNLVDGFEPLGRIELTPNNEGVTPLPGLGDDNSCQERINALLNDYGPFGDSSSPVSTGWPDDGKPGPQSNWRNINTGNVFLAQTIYNAQTSLLSAIQDVSDAEFPGVANVFINKAGALTFYGRYPRFQPTNYPNDVSIWQVADSIAAGSIGAAQIAVLEWKIDQTLLINACLCYPNLVPQTDLLDQLYTDNTSGGLYGWRMVTLSDLIVAGQPGSGDGGQSQIAQSPPSMAAAEAVCLYYAQYYVENYKVPQIRISTLEFHTRAPGDSQTWAFMTGVEIGDIVSVYTNAPGGFGFGPHAGENNFSEFFVEGIHYQVNPNTEGVPDITLTLDTSPRQYFTDMPWLTP